MLVSTAVVLEGLPVHRQARAATQASRMWIMLWGAGDAVPEGVRQHLEGAAVAIWTTTGWTIPANQAVAVNERLQYAVVEAQACTLLCHMMLA